jgi:hypothetical protein
MCDYNKVWQSMNELDLNSSKLSGIKEVINSASVSLEQHDYDATERLLYAATDLINFYTETFDREFQKAWNIVIPAAQKYQKEQDEKLIKESQEKQSWIVPVEVDDVSGEYFVTFPDELIKLTGWETDDVITWVDNNDGTFSLIKSNKNKFKDIYADDMIKAGYEMVDGTWTLGK